MWTDAEKLDRLTRHMDYVRLNCEIIGRKLMAQSKVKEGLSLIANGYTHDNSKLFGIEWDFMDPTCEDHKGLELAVDQHRRTNPHHPEYWAGIENMPDLYLAEMVADWKARSTEFGKCLMTWIGEDATKRYKFKEFDDTWNRIVVFVDMVCDKPLSHLPELTHETRV